MDEIAIDIVELQSSAARVKGGFDLFRTMIGVPQLRGDEDVLPPSRPRLERCLHRITNRFFIAISLRAIEMSKSNFQCGLRSSLGREGIRHQRAKPDRGDRAGSVGERNPIHFVPTRKTLHARAGAEVA